MQHAAAASLILGEYERILKGLGIAFAKIAPDGPEHLFPEFFRRRDQFRETVNLITPAVAEAWVDAVRRKLSMLRVGHHH